MKNRLIMLSSVDSPRRDFEWRIVLAKTLSDLGIESYVGEPAAIKELHRLTRNAIIVGRLGSNTTRSRADQAFLDEMRVRGTSLYFLHDEGAFYDHLRYDEGVRRIYPEFLFGSDLVRRVFFWGEKQRRVYGAHPSSEKFRVIGHPRLDLSGPVGGSLSAEREAALVQRYGDFVLVTGRFTLANPVDDEPHALGKRVFDIYREGDPELQLTDADISQRMFASWRKTMVEFAEFLPMIALLARELPSLNFVVRPHPAEKEAVYHQAFSRLQNVFVDKSGDVRPYIRAARVVVQSECTTGLEAEKSGIPHINFRPALEHGIESEIGGLSRLGIQARTSAEVVKSLKALSQSGFPFARSEEICDYCANAGGTISALDALVDEIVQDMCGLRPSWIAETRAERLLFWRSLRQFPEELAAKHTWRHRQRESKTYQFPRNDIIKLWRRLGGDLRNIRLRSRIVHVIAAR